MKRSLLILSLVALASVVAWLVLQPSLRGSIVIEGNQVHPAAGGVALILNEGFEETDTGGAMGSSTDGYDDPGWTAESGTFNADYATSPAPLSGSQSNYSTASGGVDYATWVYSSTANEVWVKYTINITSFAGSGQGPIQLWTSGGGSHLASVRFKSSGAVDILCGTNGTQTFTATWTTGTTYFVRFHWKNDGTLEGSFDTTDSNPTSGPNYKSLSGANGTGSFKNLYIDNGSQSNGLSGMMVDDLKGSIVGPP